MAVKSIYGASFHIPYIADPSDQGNELRGDLQWSGVVSNMNKKCIYREYKAVRCMSGEEEGSS